MTRYLLLDGKGSVLAECPALDLARRCAHLAFPDLYAWVVRDDGASLVLMAYHPSRKEDAFNARAWSGSRAPRLARRAS